MKFVYKQKTQKGGLYIPRNRDIFRDGVVQTGGMYHVNIGLPEELKRRTMDIAYGSKQRGGLGGFGNIGISQSLDNMRKNMRKKQRGGQKGGSRASGMGMFGYKHKRGTGWKPKKSKFAKKITDYLKDQFQTEMFKQQKAKAEAKGETYNPFKTY